MATQKQMLDELRLHGIECKPNIAGGVIVHSHYTKQTKAGVSRGFQVIVFKTGTTLGKIREWLGY